MVMKKERIKSLRKERLNEHFKKNGITTEFVDDFSIRLKKDVSEYSYQELRESVRKSLKRQMAKKLEGVKTFDELKKLVDSVSFGSSKVEFVSLETQDDIRYKLELVAKSAKVYAGKHTFENYQHLLPVALKNIYYYTLFGYLVKDNYGLSFAKAKISKKYHGDRWYLTGRSRTPISIYDIATLLTDIFLANSLEQFTVKNKNLYLFKQAESYVKRNYREKRLILPENDADNIILKTIKACDLIPEETEIIYDGRYNGYTEDFNLEINEEGKIENMKAAVFRIMLGELIKQTSYIKEKVERTVRETSDYARSFQTKKHINKKTLEVMKNNKFLKKYGYVEIDNDVSIDKFRKLEKEFEELTKKIYIPVCKDHSFRIKKLGKHRAAGLYYPDPIRSTIFDLDYPESYCHELGHQLDNVLGANGLLSEAVRFRRIIDKYVELVKQNIRSLRNDDPFKQQWNSKSSKYNSSYYFLPTEIFARSYELYLSHKGIETSLLKKELNSPVYPNDKEYIELITRYFDDIFFILAVPDEETVKEKPLSASKIEETIEKEREYEQLSLF